MTADIEGLRAAAARHGIAAGYDDVSGVRHDASAATLRALLEAVEGAEITAGAATADSTADDATAAVADALPPVLVLREGEPLALPLPAAGAAQPWTLTLEDGAVSHGTAVGDTLAITGPLPLGYHALQLGGDGQAPAADVSVIVCPSRCHTAPDGSRVWGLALQLYALRSARNWGIGDFTDLATVIAFAADAGASTIGLNPLHALFPDEPAQASPYSPSDRAALNALYLDVEAIADYAECAAARQLVATPEFQAQLATLRAAPFVAYPAVAAAKTPVLALLYLHFRASHLTGDTPRALAFRAFQRDAGQGLRAFATFAALREHLRGEGLSARWREWPQGHASPHDSEVAAFVAAHLARIEYFEYLQWQAELQLGAAASLAAQRRMAIGLYRDIAVGVNPDGAEAWMHGAMMARNVNIGAPPDDFNPAGQDWGLPPYAPVPLRAAAYAPFITMLRANMRHAGAIRIDHVMGLLRLFWVPAGMGPGAGTYVTYPLAELLGILALESVRHACIVVGEDLGTVPPAIRTAMADYGILSYRPLYFERTHNGAFAPPDAYPHNALVAASTHDLPTLPGYWQEADLVARAELGLYPDPAQLVAQQRDRVLDRTRLLHALAAALLLPDGIDANAPPATFTPDLVVATHQYLARTPCAVLVVQMEDVLGQLAQVNLPSTTEDAYPNWRRKLPTAVEAWRDDAVVQRVTAALRAER